MDSLRPKKFIAFSLVMLFLVSSVGSVSAQRLEITEETITELEPNVTRTYVQDRDGIRHMIYLQGPSVASEPAGGSATEHHTMKYSQIELSTGEILIEENVTNQLVLPYHYNFEMDSQDRIHTTFVADNYTIYYAVRSTDGSWNYESVNEPSEWFGWSPTIALGENELPRIVYASTLNEDARDFFGVSYPIRGLRTVFYSVSTGSSWNHYDVGDNHGVQGKEQTVFYPFYPSIKINDSVAYITFNNRISLAAESRVYYMAIPENPTQLATVAGNFEDEQHKYPIVSSTISTIFSRAEIVFIGEGVVIAAGTYNFGGVYITYNSDRDEEPAQDRAAAISQWQSEEVDLSFRSQGSISTSVVTTSSRGVLVAYSVYSVFDQQQNRYTHNVLTKSYSFIFDEDLIDENSEGMLEGTIEKITDRQNVHHEYPMIQKKVEGGNTTFDITYLQSSEESPKALKRSLFTASAPQDDNSEYAFITYLGVGTVVLSISYVSIHKFIDKKEVEEEVLPHEIHMKEAISKD